MSRRRPDGVLLEWELDGPAIRWPLRSGIAVHDRLGGLGPSERHVASGGSTCAARRLSSTSHTSSRTVFDIIGLTSGVAVHEADQPALRATNRDGARRGHADKLSINSSMIESGVSGCMNTNLPTGSPLNVDGATNAVPAVQQVGRPSLPFVASPSVAAEQHDTELWPHDQLGGAARRRARLPLRSPARCHGGSLFGVRRRRAAPARTRSAARWPDASADSRDRTGCRHRRRCAARRCTGRAGCARAAPGAARDTPARTNRRWRTATCADRR